MSTLNELARRCKQELRVLDRNRILCIATGGLANLVGSDCHEIDQIEHNLPIWFVGFVHFESLKIVLSTLVEW